MKTYLKSKVQKVEAILFFLTILLLPTQLGKHFWPASSSIFSLRIDYLSPTIYFWDILMISLILIYLIRIRLRKQWRINNYFLLVYAFFFLTQSLSLLNSINPEASYVRLKDLFIAGLLGLYISSQTMSRIKEYLLPALTISLIFTCLLAILQFLTGKTLGLWFLGERHFDVSTPLIARFNFYEQVFLRPYATFPHPNMLAAFLILALPLANFFLSQKFKKLSLINFLLTSSTIFITFSRPALLLVGLQILIHFRRFWKVLLVLLALSFPLLFVRLSSIFTFDSLAVLRRQELSEYALKIFPEYPFLGVGLNNFLNVLSLDHVLIGTNRFLQPVHNIFLLTLSETGLIGLLGFTILLLSGVALCLKSTSVFSKILFGNLIILIFLGLFDHYFLTLPQGQRLLFMLIGLAFVKDLNSSNSSGILSREKSRGPKFRQ